MNIVTFVTVTFVTNKMEAGVANDPAVPPFTACKTGEACKSYADDLAFEAGSGQIYLMSSLQAGKSTINPDVPDRWARNMALVRQ